MALFAAGFLACLPILAVLGAAVFAAVCAASWLNWKTRQINCRREWTQENPYWREAFEAGAKWADGGKSRAQPNLTSLRMPGAKKGGGR